MHPISTVLASSADTAQALTPEVPGLPRDHGLLYLVIAGLCLVLALHIRKWISVPIGPLVRAAVAVAVIGLAVGAALVFLIAAALTSR